MEHNTVQKNTVQHGTVEKKSAIRAVIRSQLWKIFGLLDYMWKIFVYYIKSGDLFTCDNKEEFAV